jgi:21S rRNA (GM2251-2'-O)-methyltransferase
MNHKERDENNNNLQSATAVKTNLKQIESAGYEHLYGIAPVLNALKANIRDFSNPEDEVEEEKLEVLELQRRLAGIDGTSWEDDDTVEDIGADKKDIKPEAKCAPCLFVQEGTLDNTKRSFRSAPKNEASAEIISLAQQVDSLNVVEVDKGVLNTLCGNRPHQGFVLRCGGLEFKPLKSGLPLPSGGGGESALPTLWLALDEVVDPQNLGALLRSSYFLGGGASVIDGSDKDITDDGRSGRVGILVCSKNSSPLTPTVSAASAGALEFMTIYSTSNLPKLLNNARDDGWRVLGAAAEVPDTGVSSKRAGRDSRKNIVTTNDWEVLDDEDVDEDTDITEYATPSVPLQQNEQKCVNLGNVAVEPGPPTILVLGSEGRGLRTLVARACTSFVKIPGGTSHGSDTQAGVDSLNVSVTGGILLYHFLSSNASKN